MKLVRQCSGEQVNVGDRVVDFRGTTAVVTGWSEPHKPESTGRVHITEGENSTGSYYPEVFGLEFVEG